MFRKSVSSNSQKAGLQTTQIQELVIDLTEHEQEIISGFGGRDDCWCLLSEFRIGVENSERQKQFVNSNFKLDIPNLPCG